MSLAAVSFHPLAKQSKVKRDIPPCELGLAMVWGLGAGGLGDAGLCWVHPPWPQCTGRESTVGTELCDTGCQKDPGRKAGKVS